MSEQIEYYVVNVGFVVGVDLLNTLDACRLIVETCDRFNKGFNVALDFEMVDVMSTDFATTFIALMLRQYPNEEIRDKIVSRNMKPHIASVWCECRKRLKDMQR